MEPAAVAAACASMAALAAASLAVMDSACASSCSCVCKQWNSYLSTPKFGRIHLCKQKQLATMDFKLLIFNSLDDSQPRRSFFKLDCETLNAYRGGDDDNDDDSYEWVACDLWRLDGDGDGCMGE
ncbi:F-box/kelch-repeat protein-like protein, partial [Tanacetum coccineum]